MPHDQHVEERPFAGHYLCDEDNCRYLYAPPLDSPTHKHTDFYEFSLVTRGSWINEYGGKRRVLRKNTLIFFGCGQTHGMYVGEPESLHFSFIATKEFFEDYCRQHFAEHPEMTKTPYVEVNLSHENAEYLTAVFDRIILTPGTDHTELFRLFLYNALYCTFLQPHTKNVREEDDDTNKYIKDMVYHFDAFDYLTADVSAIYQSYPLSQSTLINQFKKYTGYSIVQYRHLKRMEYAARMLDVYFCSVSEVATAVGISSISYFSKKFKEHYGILPSDYQKQSINPRVKQEKSITDYGTSYANKYQP
ncbi:MAG: AraC family transcriptional regulator [Clostridia bacterium]|nr:AraC family transcriptional regulator [Clostridia bacterium]